MSVHRFGIRTKVSAFAAIAVLITLAAGCAVIVVAVRQLAIAGIDTTLTDRANAVASLAAAGRLPTVIPDAHGRPSLVQVVTAGGQVIAATASIQGEPPAAPLPTGVDHLVTTVSSSALGSQPFRLRMQAVPVAGRTEWIVVAASLDAVDAVTADLILAFAVGVPLLAAVLAVVAARAVALALAPVESIRRRVAEIGGGDLGERVPVPPARDEIATLAATMNEMLGRLQAAAERQERFIGDASHELRSPLAALRAELDVAAAHPDAQDPAAALRTAAEQAERMTRLIDDLLALARASEPASLPTTSVDLDELVLAEARRLRLAGGMTVTVHADAARVQGSARDLTRAIANLGDNAVQHASSAVDLAVRVDAGRARVTVSDDGVGIPEPDRDRVFDRFTRLDPSRRRRAAGGSGLGLAIVRAIVERHGGTVVAGSRADGRPGAELVLELPVALHAQRSEPPD